MMNKRTKGILCISGGVLIIFVLTLLTTGWTTALTFLAVISMMALVFRGFIYIMSSIYDHE